MRTVRGLLLRLAGLFHKERKDREFTEEIETHLHFQMDDNLRTGMTAEQARRDALLRSGGLEQAREAYRDLRSVPAIETALRDLSHAARLLGRSPGFTAAAVLSLALGIGANTAVFTLLDQLLLRLLPVSDPDRLVMIWTTGPHLGGNQGARAASYPMYQDFQQRSEAFSYVFCRYQASLAVSIGKETERVRGELVSGNFFQALGVGAALGRVFSPEQDDRVYKGHPVAVITHQYWLTRFGADPGVIGRTILVNNVPMAIVGVSSAGFSGLDPMRSAQIRIPIQMKPLMTPTSDNLGSRRNQWVQIFARMKPGYTARRAQASLEPLLAQVLRQELSDPVLRNTSLYDRDRFLARKVRLEPAANGYSDFRRSYSAALIVLMSMVGLLLLVACFNVANLLIARAGARQKEVAVRLALGASRTQLFRQLLIESLLLAAGGGGAGLLAAIAMTKGMLSFLPPGEGPLALRAGPDWRVLTFSIALAFVAALLSGLAPAWHTVRLDLWSTLKEAGGALAGNRGPVRLRKGMVAAQVLFSFLLLAGAGLFVKTLANLKQAGSGIRGLDSVVTFQISPSLSGYGGPQTKDLCERILEGVRSAAGVRTAAYAWVPILHGYEADWGLTVEGHSAADGENRQSLVNLVSPGYWRTMGLPLLAGRDFDARDQGSRYTVAIVSRTFARQYFGDRNPIGRHIGFDNDRSAQPAIEIVGVVDDSLYEGPREGMRRQVYFPFAQTARPAAAVFYARASGSPEALFAALRDSVREADPAVPVYEMKTLDAQLDETLSTERLVAALSTSFGILATVLAAVGLYGVMALAVFRRTREIGLRMALGARRGAVLWMVLREAFGLLGIGLAVGMPCAYWLSRYVSSQLYGVTPADPTTAVAAAAVLAAVAAASALAPARRASSIDPIRALRHE
jgi:predicted permease